MQPYHSWVDDGTVTPVNGLIFNTADKIECSPLRIFGEIKKRRLSQELLLFKSLQVKNVNRIVS
ncbi:bacteriocin immunity protein [Escherichia coli]|nr:bacteriocin immunity protein [Escherichia coli]ELK9439239.1 bacteriocin immunity protein [Escherichia coli]ELO4948435.1 bacteriocin immunity protein [Escherichia coli]ELO4958057.1 bacteriocin immunity protein [Escherichia coli]